MGRVVIITNTNPFNPEASHYAHDAKTECLRHGEAPLSACEFTAENKGDPEKGIPGGLMGQLDVNDTHVVGRMGVEERSKVPLAERSWVA